MPGDNFSISVTSDRKEHFEAAVRMAFSNAPGNKATHYKNGLEERLCVTCYGCGEERTATLDATPEGLAKAVQAAMVMVRCRDCGGVGKAIAEPAIILFWHNPDDCANALPLPFQLDVEAAVPFLRDWLRTADYGPEPDHDGDNKKGFIVTTGDFWGHCEGSHYSVLMVKPDWQMYGK